MRTLTKLSLATLVFLIFAGGTWVLFVVPLVWRVSWWSPRVAMAILVIIPATMILIMETGP